MFLIATTVTISGIRENVLVVPVGNVLLKSWLVWDNRCFRYSAAILSTICTVL